MLLTCCSKTSSNDPPTFALLGLRDRVRHQHCLHAGLLRLSGRAPDGLFFELGLRPGASPLVRYRAGDIGVPPPRAA